MKLYCIYCSSSRSYLAIIELAGCSYQTSWKVVGDSGVNVGGVACVELAVGQARVGWLGGW